MSVGVKLKVEDAQCNMKVVERGTIPLSKPKTFVLPEVELSEAEWYRAQIKAGLAYQNDLVALVRDAVEHFRPVAPQVKGACLYCGGELEPTLTTVEVVKGITVSELPADKCGNCNRVSGPQIALLAALEEMALAQGWPEGTSKRLSELLA